LLAAFVDAAMFKRGLTAEVLSFIWATIYRKYGKSQCIWCFWAEHDVFTHKSALFICGFYPNIRMNAGDLL